MASNFKDRSRKILAIVMTMIILFILTPATWQVFAQEAGKNKSNNQSVKAEMRDAVISDSNLVLKWISNDQGTVNGDTLAINSFVHEYSKIEMAIDFSASITKGVCQPGEIVIKIPRYMLKDRDGNNQGEVLTDNFPFVKKGETGGKTIFSYELTDDYIVLTNYEAVSGKYNMNAVVEYRQNNPKIIANGYTGKIQGSYGFDGGESEKSNSLIVKNTSKTEIMKGGSVESRKNFGGLYKSWDDSWGDKPADADEYFYCWWDFYIRATYRSTQPYNWLIEENYEHGAQPVAIARAVYHNKPEHTKKFITKYAENGKLEISGTIMDPSESYDYVAVLIRYPKSLIKDIPEDGELQISNEADLKIEGIDKGSPGNSEDTHRMKGYYTYKPPKKDKPTNGYFYNYKSSDSDSHGVGLENAPLFHDEKLFFSYQLSSSVNNPDKGEGAGFKLSQIDDNPLSVLLVGDEKKVGEFIPGDDYYYKSISGIEGDLGEYVWDENKGWKTKKVENSSNAGQAVLSIKTKDDTSWQEYGKYTLLLKNGRLSLQDKENKEVVNIIFDKEVTYFKIDWKTTYEVAHFKVSTGGYIKPSENAKKILKDNRNEKGLYINNIADFRLTDLKDKKIGEDEKNGKFKIVDTFYHAYLYKTNKKVEMDTAKNQVINHYRLEAVYRLDPSYVAGKAYTDDINDANGDIFYDLLPKGVDGSNIKNTRIGTLYIEDNYYEENLTNKHFKNLAYSIEYIKNWHDTGQTMMKVKIKHDGFSSKYFYGLRIVFDYDMVLSFDDIEDLEGEYINIAAYQTHPNDRLKNGKGDTADDKLIASNKEYEKFKDLNDDGKSEDKDTFYDWTRSKVQLPNASESYFKKQVGKKGGKFSSEIEVDENEIYSYRFKFKTPKSSKGKGIIFYDILEKEHENNEYWQGVLKGLDRGNIDKYKADLKVYYSTRDDLTIYNSDGTASSQADLSDASIWSLTKPADEKKIKAVAFDLRKTTDGTDLVLPNDSLIYMGMDMQASPKNYEKYREYIENKDNKDKPLKAYNAAMTHSILIDSHGNETENTRKANTTKTGIKNKEIEVRKNWEFLNGSIDDIDESINVQLYADGKPVKDKIVELNKKNDWKNSFNNLVPRDKDNPDKLIDYSVKEVGEKKGIIKVSNKTFEASYDGSMKDGFTIKNKEKMPWTPMEPPTRNVKVSKAWKDSEGKPLAAPIEKIEVELYKDGVATGKKLELTKDNNWTVTFEKLKVYESIENPAIHKYTVKEVGENGSVIKFNEKWFEVSYDGTMADGFTVTNKEKKPWTPMEPPTRNVKVSKAWKDSEGKPLAAPIEKIEVELYKDGVATGKKLELTNDNNWSGAFKNLEVADGLGSTNYYRYTVKEIGETTGSIKFDSEWFKVSYTGSMKDGFTITNQKEKPWTPMEPPIREVKVTKLWKDHKGNTVTAPTDKITIELYKDGNPTGKTLELNGGNNWSGVFKNLEVANGLGSTDYYKYTVKEVGEDGNAIKFDGKQYKVVYEGSMKDGLTITNEKEAPPTPPTPPNTEKPKTPNTSTNNSLPKTGDGTNLYLYAWLMFASVSLLVLLSTRKRKYVK